MGGEFIKGNSPFLSGPFSWGNQSWLKMLQTRHIINDYYLLLCLVWLLGLLFYVVRDFAFLGWRPCSILIVLIVQLVFCILNSWKSTIVMWIRNCVYFCYIHTIEEKIPRFFASVSNWSLSSCKNISKICMCTSKENGLLQLKWSDTIEMVCYKFFYCNCGNQTSEAFLQSSATLLVISPNFRSGFSCLTCHKHTT